VQQANGLKPQIFLRKQAVEPRYDTRDGAMILKQIADRIGTGKFFPYENIEDLVEWQLKNAGFSMKDFEKKGFVAYGKNQIFWNRLDGLKFKTPSGKVEFKSSLLEDAGFESFPEYEPVPPPPKGKFRLIVGRNALHTHVSTQNNAYLNDLCPENMLWINEKAAAEQGISDGDTVQVSSKVGKGSIKAKVTDLIHPDAVFILHGFGHESRSAERSYDKGLSDALLQENLTDKVGGSPALHDTFVSVKPV
jgi:thiosulfate reductase/polysulfide reductase chain A